MHVRGEPARQSSRKSRGQSLVEFALILPVIMLMLLIAIDFGRLFFSYVTLTNVTRIAANYGSIDPASFTGTPSLTTYNAVVTKETGGLNCQLRADTGGHNPPIPVVPANPTLGSMSVATMTCDFSLVTPIIGAVLAGGSIPITVTSEFPIRVGAISNIGGGTTLPPPGSPTAAFTFTGVSGGTINGSGNVTGTVPVTVNVVNASTNAQTYDWDWGDGSHEFVAAPTPHTYNVARNYNVTLTVTNPSGSSSLTRVVSVTDPSAPPPVAGFYGTPVGAPPAADGGGPTGTAITGSRGLIVNITNISTNGTAYSWNFGDGTGASTASDPQHQYNTRGTYTVVLTITAPTGGSPFTRSSYVTVGCVIPNFANTSTGAADTTWQTAGYASKNIRYLDLTDRNPQPKNNPPGAARNIESQTVAGGTFSNPNASGGCDDSIVVNYR
jgi:PKD repeat protein